MTFFTAISVPNMLKSDKCHILLKIRAGVLYLKNKTDKLSCMAYWKAIRDGIRVNFWQFISKGKMQNTNFHEFS